MKVADVAWASRIKKDLYLEAGAQEVWIVYLDSHMDIFTTEGQKEETEFSEGIRKQIF